MGWPASFLEFHRHLSGLSNNAFAKLGLEVNFVGSHYKFDKLKLAQIFVAIRSEDVSQVIANSAGRDRDLHIES